MGVNVLDGIFSVARKLYSELSKSESASPEIVHSIISEATYCSIFIAMYTVML